MLADLLVKHRRILAECAIAEQLRRMPGITLHPTLFNTPLIYSSDHGADAMAQLYIEYIQTAEMARLPLLFLDSAVTRPPEGYLVNCTHPRFLLNAYAPGALARLVGIQANGSSKDVTNLDGARCTHADPFANWARDMEELHIQHGVAILGGCCGTSAAHLRSLAKLTES